MADSDSIWLSSMRILVSGEREIVRYLDIKFGRWRWQIQTAFGFRR